MRVAPIRVAIVAVAACCGVIRGQGMNPLLDAAPDELPTNVVKVLRTSNKEQINRYVPKVYDFKNVNPYAAIRQIRRVMEIEESAWFSFASPEMNSGKLLVIVPEYQIPGLDQLVATIDVPEFTSSSGTKRVYYRLRHRDAFDTNFSGPALLEGTPTALIMPDIQTNSILIEDAPSGVTRITDAVVSDYDQPTPQCEAHLSVYEVDITDDGQLGLDYVAWKNGPGRNLFALGAFAQREKISTLDGGATALLYNSGKNTANLSGNLFESTGRNGAFFYDLPSAYFDYLVTQGRARIVTKSKLVTLNRNTAFLEVGDDILFYNVNHNPDLRAGSRLVPLDPYGDLEAVVDTGAAGQVTDDFGVLVADHPDNRTVVPMLQERALGLVSTGFFFQFIPTINQIGCTIDMIASVVDHTGYADNGTPTLASRSIDTTFKIPHDGRTITIGGLSRTQRIDSANKMPWLGDIPVLGYLFGGESRLEHKASVFMVLSARVAEAGVNNASAEDLEIADRASRNASTRTKENNPGFLNPN